MNQLFMNKFDKKPINKASGGGLSSLVISS